VAAKNGFCIKLQMEIFNKKYIDPYPKQKQNTKNG